MDSADRTVRQWAGLPRTTLVVKVAAMVRQPPQDPSQFWRLVGGDVVLAAAVRGILAGLLRDKQGNRDESFWAYRIAAVRAMLDSPEQAPASTDEVATSPGSGGLHSLARLAVSTSGPGRRGGASRAYTAGRSRCSRYRVPRSLIGPLATSAGGTKPLSAHAVHR
jgi:hypothetical protein